ncbi:DUF4432 family protein [Streptomyces sp. BBFR25]|uniref:DUF4432 family protein n=1 Tax=unclassified Streptomyces TaxID=2593676 RepID=UPI001EE9A9D5|nr:MULTISPECIES: DUF4432 family protein [unclassified Streptomyces]
MRITGYRSLATAREWGRPVGDEGARYELPPHRTLWRSDSVAAQGVSDTEMPAPLPGFVEQVYEHALEPDAAGLARPRLVNEHLGAYFELEFDTARFRVGHLD